MATCNFANYIYMYAIYLDGKRNGSSGIAIEQQVFKLEQRGYYEHTGDRLNGGGEMDSFD